MTGLNWFLQLIIIGAVAAFDMQKGAGVAGFILAALYSLGSLISLIQRDRPMLKKRAFLVLVFLVEIVVVSALVHHPLHLHLLRRLEKGSEGPI